MPVTLLVVAAAGAAPGLVAKLGDADFRVRERATRDLVALGWRAEPAVRAGLATSPNPEVRDRCEWVLGAERRAFLADPDARPFSYPGYRHFLPLLRKSEAIRAAFLAAAADSPELLRGYDADPKVAAAGWLAEFRATLVAYRKGTLTKALPHGRVAVLLFPAANPAVPLPDKFWTELESLCDWTIHTRTPVGVNSAPLRYPAGVSLLFAEYFRRWTFPKLDYYQRRLFQTAAGYQMHEYAVPLAVEFVRPGTDEWVAETGLKVIRAFGGPDQLPAVEAVFGDTRELNLTGQTADPRPQLRDIALHAAEYLTCPYPAARRRPYPLFRPGTPDRARAFAAYFADRQTN